MFEMNTEEEEGEHFNNQRRGRSEYGNPSQRGLKKKRKIPDDEYEDRRESRPNEDEDS